MMQILSPAFGAELSSSDALSVCWVYQRLNATVRLELCQANGRPAAHIAQCPNIGVYTWRPNAHLYTGTYVIVMRDVDTDAQCQSGPFRLITTLTPYVPSEPSWRMQETPRALETLSIEHDSLTIVNQLLDETMHRESSARDQVPLITASPFGTSAVKHFVPRLHNATDVTRRFHPRLKPRKTIDAPPVEISAAEVRQCMRELLKTPHITIDRTLGNGDTAGEFCVKYLIMIAQKRERKEQEAKRS